jgi:hypothetical protein
VSNYTLFNAGTKIGIGTNAPAALLHTYGTSAGSGNVLFEGDVKTSGHGNPPASGSGTRMMWYPDKGAFRAGYVNGGQWNKDSIGTGSIAMGAEVKASGSVSTAIGAFNVASGTGSTALGHTTLASGYYSTAFGRHSKSTDWYSSATGYNTTASGRSSFAGGEGSQATGNWSFAFGEACMATGTRTVAMGIQSQAKGSSSIALGHVVEARSFAEVAVGTYCELYTPSSATSYNANDRAFVVGIGSSSGNPKNALTVMKSGSVGIGTSSPGNHRLNVTSDQTSPTGFIENTASNGIGLKVETTSTDGTLLINQKGTGYALRCDRWTSPTTWSGVTFIVRGDKVGIGTSTPSYQLQLTQNSAAKPSSSSWTIASDIRLKEVIGSYDKGLQELLQLDPIVYRYKEDNALGITWTEAYSYGFSAQEVQKVFPEAVNTVDGYLNLDIHPLLIAQINAIRELNRKIEDQKKEIDRLKNEDQKREIDLLREELRQLRQEILSK